MTWNKGRILMCLSLRIKILCSRCETGVTSVYILAFIRRNSRFTTGTQYFNP